MFLRSTGHSREPVLSEGRRCCELFERDYRLTLDAPMRNALKEIPSPHASSVFRAVPGCAKTQPEILLHSRKRGGDGTGCLPVSPVLGPTERATGHVTPCLFSESACHRRSGLAERSPETPGGASDIRFPKPGESPKDPLWRRWRLLDRRDRIVWSWHRKKLEVVEGVYLAKTLSRREINSLHNFLKPPVCYDCSL
jgi:hypothetical protein